MAVDTNTLQTYQTVGNREALMNVITRTDPEETPFQSLIATGRPGITGIKPEVQVQALDPVDINNAVIEGDNPSADAVTPSVRVENYTQISDKEAIVSDTQQAVVRAGSKSEMGNQIMLKSLSLKRDIEAIITRNQGYNAGAAGTARKTRSLESFLVTNSSRGTGGLGGTATAGATDGTQRAFTEVLLKDVIKKCEIAGGKPDCIMVGPSNKQVFSTFAGNATRFQGTVDRKLITTFDVYVSDFGDLRIIPNVQQRDRTVFVLEKKKWAVGFLQPFSVEKLAKTGHAEKRLIRAEYALISYNEAASGVVADLTTP